MDSSSAAGTSMNGTEGLFCMTIPPAGAVVARRHTPLVRLMRETPGANALTKAVMVGERLNERNLGQ